MQRLLTVRGEADWAELRDRRLVTVLDPVILHTADLFFTGPASADGRVAAWETIHDNIGAFMTFVEAALMWDELPVFSSGGPDLELLTREPLAGLFWPVCVTGDEERICRDSAAAEAERVPSPSRLRPDGPPEFGDEPDTPLPVVRRRLLDFLLHDAYAQRLSTEDGSQAPGSQAPGSQAPGSQAPGSQAQRIVEPKRARLLARVATGASQPREAFDALTGRVGLTRFPQAPVFLPLLLQESDILTPAHLADRVMVWRTTGAVRDYRAWLGRLRTTLARGGSLDGLAPDLAAIAAKTGGAAADLAVDVGIDALVVAPGRGQPVGFGKQRLDGGRHQKIMVRALASPSRYQELSDRLRRIWFNG